MLEFIAVHQLGILRWLHILCMVYWLGGEWGVFQTSHKVVNPAYTVDERLNHLDTVFRIDILARIGIISLLPLGLHMGHLWGVQPYGGVLLLAVWGLWAGWLAVTLAAFANRKNPKGNFYGIVEDWTRYTMIVVLLGVSLSSLLGYGPFEAGDGQKWFAAKILLLSLLFVVGVVLRSVLHEWPAIFAQLKQGDSAEAEARLQSSIKFGRRVAMVYWTGIAFAGFLGAVKPF